MNVEYILSTFLATLKGVPTTLFITFFALIVSLPIGLLLAITRIKKVPVLAQLSRIYTLILRGTPLILLILLAYSFIPSFLNALFKRWDIPIDVFKINPLVYACLIFLIVSVAAISEIFRSALSAVDKGQFEAGQSVGLSQFHIYLRIILPQAIISALPNICNLAVTLVKGTSLVFVMTVKDITAIAKINASYGYNYAESYLVIFVVYILICALIQFGFKKLAQYLAFDNKKKASVIAPPKPVRLTVNQQLEKGVTDVTYS